MFEVHVFFFLFSGLVSGFAWGEPLLAAVVPDADTGLSVLQVMRLSGAQDGGDDCLCSVVLDEDSRQPAGKMLVVHYFGGTQERVSCSAYCCSNTNRKPRIDWPLHPSTFVFLRPVLLI